MFSKIAIVAALAVVATAQDASFADDSFLDSMGDFEEAQRKREAYVKEHLALVANRFKTAHTYFNAKDKEASAKNLRARWNAAWTAAVTVHEKAIAHHDFTVEQMNAALARKLKAIAAHKITVKSLATANKHRSAALKAWNKSKDNLTRSEEDMEAAKVGLASAEHVEDRAHKDFDDKHAMREDAAKADARAAAEHKAAVAHHKASAAADDAADKAERVAARARSAAFKKHQAAIKAHTAAINEKAAALKAAIKAHKDVLKHSAKNGQFAL